MKVYIVRGSEAIVEINVKLILKVITDYVNPVTFTYLYITYLHLCIAIKHNVQTDSFV